METGETARSKSAAIITVHGTGDTAEGLDGEKWYQRGSEFSGWLTEELASRGVEAEIHPFLWSGANSATAREEAARALVQEVRELAKTHESVHIMGHSHGGNVANEAAAMLGWAGGKDGGDRAKDRLRSISTVGTPFFRSEVSNGERFGAYGFGATALISAALVAVLLAAPSWLLERLTGDEWYVDDAGVETFQSAFSMWLRGVGVAGLIALAFIIPIAWRGLMRIRRAGVRRPKAGLFSLWHPLDEAIAFLQRVETLPIEPFAKSSLWRGSRTGGVLWGVRAVFVLPVLGLLALAANWGLDRFRGDAPNYPPYGFGPAPLEAVAQQILLFGVAGAPVVFAAVYLLYRAFAFVGLETLARGPLNLAVGGALKGIAFGKDGDHNPGNVSSRSHRFGTQALVLDGPLAEHMAAASKGAAEALFAKYRGGAFSVDADQNEVVREIAEDALTWDALIHTTYFDHREIAEAVADHLAAALHATRLPATLLPPASPHEGTGLATRLLRTARGLGLGAASLAATLAALLVAVTVAAVWAEPWANKDHLADERGFIPPPAPFVNGQIIAKGADCAECPEMVVLPGGTFSMGSPTTEEYRNPNEGPMRRVTVEPFAVGRFEVTWAEWDACVAAGGCDGRGPESAGGDEGWGRSDRPVINVSWNDAKAYVAWLNTKVEGAPYRLLTETEWEYAARAGTTSAYWWGDEASPEYAKYLKIAPRQTVPVGSYPANPFGLHDMHGNIVEWVEDCYRGNPGLPLATTAAEISDCPRVLRGGSWGSPSYWLRSAFRNGTDPSLRLSGFGFRLARTL